MKRKAILLGVLTLFVAGSASAKIMDTWTRISLQFTNLARAQASDTGIGVSTLNTSGSGMHLNTMSLGNGTLPGLSLNTILPITDPIVSNGGIVSVRLTNVRGGNVAGPNNNLGVLGPVSGAIQSTLPLGERGTLRAELPLRQGHTFYTRFGDVFAYACAALTAAALLGGLAVGSRA